MGLNVEAKKFIKNWQETKASNKLLTILASGLVVANILLAGKLISVEEKVVMIPPNLSEEAWVSKNAASSSLHRTWGLYVATLAGNVNPGNVDFTVKELTNLASPRIYADFKNFLLSEAESIRLHKATSVFEATNVHYDTEDNFVYVVGVQTVSTPEGGDETKKIYYKIQFEINNSRPYMVLFEKKNEVFNKKRLITDKLMEKAE